MNFGKAIEELKNGEEIRRKTWGEGNVIFLMKGSRDISGEDTTGRENVDGIPFHLFEMGQSETVTRYPVIRLFDKGNEILQDGWTPMPYDIFAEDWVVVGK